MKELSDAILKASNLKVLRLEGNTIAPEAAEELSKSIEKVKLERFIGNDLFTGRLKDEIPLALVIWDSNLKILHIASTLANKN